jgi:hypothetical protein
MGFFSLRCALAAARGDALAVEMLNRIAIRKDAYLRVHPETKNGGDRGNQYIGGKVAVRQNSELIEKDPPNVSLQSPRKWLAQHFFTGG